MSAMRAIQARQASALSDAIREAMEAKGWKSKDLARAVYGVDAAGHTKGTGDAKDMVTSPNFRPTDGTLRKYADALDISFEDLQALRDSIPRFGTTPPGRPSKALPAPPSLLDRLSEPDHDDAPPQFSLVIGQDGRATLSLNLVDVPMQTAMRAMAALTSAGLLDAGEKD